MSGEAGARRPLGGKPAYTREDPRPTETRRDPPRELVHWVEGPSGLEPLSTILVTRRPPTWVHPPHPYERYEYTVRTDRSVIGVVPGG